MASTTINMHTGKKLPGVSIQTYAATEDHGVFVCLTLASDTTTVSIFLSSLDDVRRLAQNINTATGGTVS